MAPTARPRALFSNGHQTRISLFDDGRVKVWSPAYSWRITGTGRPNPLGEYVRLEPGDPIDGDGGTESAIEIHTDPANGAGCAGVITASNGTYIEIDHDGAITVGNDGRDLAETFNAWRPSTGGSVMVTFHGDYRPRTIRAGDHHVEITETHKPVPNRLYPDEREIVAGKILRVGTDPSARAW